MTTTATAPDVRHDLEAAKRVARRYLHLQTHNAAFARVCTRANTLLAIEWLGQIVVTLAVVYLLQPWWLAALALVPWFIYSTLALDNIVHATNHWPVFRREAWNVAWRALGVLVFWCPLEVRYHHWQHHRAYDLADDPQTLLRAICRRTFWGRRIGVCRYLAIETLRSVVSFLPWSKHPDYIRSLRTKRPAHYWEIVVSRWACLAWLGLLGYLGLERTLFLLIPGSFLVSPLASLLMNLTDHLPADLAHPFRQATYGEPKSRFERVVSALNHQTAATHLTHHLFPQVHFAHCRRLQRRLLASFRRHDAPQSLVLNSILIGNPIALYTVLRTVLRGAVQTKPWDGVQSATSTGTVDGLEPSAALTALAAVD
ncbi:MAG: fatty acid desaturase [Planctomycetota bacterium]